MRLASLITLCLLSACGSHDPVATSLFPPRPLGAGPSATPPPPLETSATRPLESAPAAARAPFDPSVVAIVLDDPKLAAAKALVLAGKPLDAAKAIDEAHAVRTNGRVDARWDYRAALLRKAGGDPKGAATSFESAAAFGGPLEPYALLQAAELLLAAGESTRPAGDLEAVDAGAVPRSRLGLARARALARTGDLDDSLAQYRELAKTRDKSWASNALELARVLLSHPGGTHALEAAHLALDVELDGPANREGDAKKLREEAEGALSSADKRAFDAPTATEKLERAKRLLASGRAKKALAIVDGLSKEDAGSCGALVLRPNALYRVGRTSEALTAFDQAVALCGVDPSASPEPHPSRGDALFTVAVGAMEQDDWKQALDALTQGEACAKERSYQRAGRFSYFRGRALLATGHAEEGIEELAATIDAYPLSYYAALAYARLEEIATGKGKAALEARLAREVGSLPAAPSDEVEKSSAFTAAVELAGEDDVEGVLSALETLGVLDRSAPPEVTLAGAELLGRTSSPSAAHLLLRSASEYEPDIGRREVYAFRDAYPVGAFKSIWELAYPRAFQAGVERASSESGIPEALLYAIAREESAFEPTALSKAGAIGLTQVMPHTARNGAKRLGLPFNDAAVREPGENLRLGAHFLKQMRDDFSDDPLLAIPAYNAGPGAPEKWAKAHPDLPFDLFVEEIPFAETRGYTKRVIATLATYEVLYGSLDTSEAFHAPKLARNVSGPRAP